MRQTALLALALLAAALVAPASHASASSVTVDSPLPIQATLNGAPFLITSPTFSAQGTLCLPQSVYQSSFSRSHLSGWYVNSTRVSTAQCISLSGQAYLAHYTQQYLVTVTYVPQNVVANGTWVDAGVPVVFNVPTLIQGSSYSYQLENVLVAGSAVYAPAGSVTVSASSPVSVQAVYQQLVNVTFVLPSGRSTDWAPVGQQLYTTFPAVLSSNGTASYRLDGFLVTGTAQYSTTSSSIMLVPTTPVLVRPLYQLYYYVTVSSPTGVLQKGWYRAGSLLNLSAPQTIQLNPQEKLVFTGWNGASQPNQASVPVTGPLNLTADYAATYEVDQVSPLGTTTQFLRANTPTALSFPQTLAASIGFVRTLTQVLVNGSPIPNQNGVVVVTVTGPSQVVAEYSYTPDWVFITLVAAAVLVVVAGYVVRARLSRPHGAHPHDSLSES